MEEPPPLREPSRKERRHERKKRALESIDSLECISTNNDIDRDSSAFDVAQAYKKQKESPILLDVNFIMPSQVINRKRLLVLDLNKVLLYRIPNSSQYIVRPHTEEFINAMSTHFSLAIWTSMSKSSAKRILKHLFPTNNGSIQLLFRWYQNRCITLQRPVSAVISTDIENDLESECSERPDKPIFLKNLSQVWKEYPTFSSSDTILMDDSPEKCINNAKFNLIHPCPFRPKVIRRNVYTEEETGEAANIDNEEDDTELKPGGVLWTRLMSIADFKGSLEEWYNERNREISSSDRNESI